MNSKYVVQHLDTGVLVAKPFDSCIWRSIVELRPKLDALAYWKVGNGSNINMWEEA